MGRVKGAGKPQTPTLSATISTPAIFLSDEIKDRGLDMTLLGRPHDIVISCTGRGGIGITGRIKGLPVLAKKKMYDTWCPSDLTKWTVYTEEVSLLWRHPCYTSV